MKATNPHQVWNRIKTPHFVRISLVLHTLADVYPLQLVIHIARKVHLPLNIAIIHSESHPALRDYVNKYKTPQLIKDQRRSRLVDRERYVFWKEVSDWSRRSKLFGGWRLARWLAEADEVHRSPFSPRQGEGICGMWLVRWAGSDGPPVKDSTSYLLLEPNILVGKWSLLNECDGCWQLGSVSARIEVTIK